MYLAYPETASSLQLRRCLQVILTALPRKAVLTGIPNAHSQAKKKKKENLYTASSQLRADQAPNPPWADRLSYTDQIDVPNQ